MFRHLLLLDVNFILKLQPLLSVYYIIILCIFAALELFFVCHRCKNQVKCVLTSVECHC